jgi:flagellar protein FlaG
MEINAVTRGLDTIELVRSGNEGAGKSLKTVSFDQTRKEQDKPEVKSADLQSVRDDVERSIKAFEELAGRFNKALDLSIDQDSDKIVVKVVNKATEKVIREIPSEEFLEFSERMHDFLGVLFDETA